MRFNNCSTDLLKPQPQEERACLTTPNYFPLARQHPKTELAILLPKQAY